LCGENGAGDENRRTPAAATATAFIEFRERRKEGLKGLQLVGNVEQPPKRFYGSKHFLKLSDKQAEKHISLASFEWLGSISGSIVPHSFGPHVSKAFQETAQGNLHCIARRLWHVQQGAALPIGL
jgi:hypothetical protein